MKGRLSRNANIDLGLAVTREMILDGRLKQPVNLRVLSAACGVSWQAMSFIEQRALRKIRVFLYRNPELNQELMDHIRKYNF